MTRVYYVWPTRSERQESFKINKLKPSQKQTHFLAWLRSYLLSFLLHIPSAFTGPECSNETLLDT